MSLLAEYSRPPVARKMLPRISAPSHRHAAPCAPWPWVDLEDNIQDPAQRSLTVPAKCSRHDERCEGCWAGYPQSLFPNWTSGQVEKSKMLKAVFDVSDECVLHLVDVADNGHFSDIGKFPVKEDEEFWKFMRSTDRPKGGRLRALFVENLSVSVLQMLGTKYNVEPFFWTSSVNWIPARYQEEVRPRQGDHITITLTFPRAIRRDTTSHPLSNRSSATFSSAQYFRRSTHLDDTASAMIDTHSALPLLSGDQGRNYDIVLDLLAIHMIRNTESSTIISYHPTSDRQNTPAANLHSRVYLAGQSVYWQDVFQQSSDPTFVLLTILWYALYAWDQALELLWEHICQLELNVISTNNMHFTRELHRIRAHLLHYASLLEDFRKSVQFVLDTPNPAMEFPSHEPERRSSRALLEKECGNLLSQMQRLDRSIVTWNKRLTNIMNLAFSSVNIADSKHMQRLTKAAVRDSAAMKQLSYLTMFFLPASFVATAFGMNVKEVNPDASGTLAHYVETAVPLTVVTIWVIVALQSKWRAEGEDGGRPRMSLWRQLGWPAVYLQEWIQRRKRRAPAPAPPEKYRLEGYH